MCVSHYPYPYHLSLGEVYITPKLWGVEHITPSTMKPDKYPPNFSKPDKLPPEVVWYDGFATVIVVLNFSFLFYFG
jgi:hypothetical protein